MTRIPGRRALIAAAVASMLVGAPLAVPGNAHDSTSTTHNWRRHYRVLAKEIFYTKAASNARFVNVGERASDADLLDGLSSGAFAASTHAHAGEDVTSGTIAEARIAAALARDAEVFGIVTNADGSGSGLDADLLDGLSSGAFAASGETQAARWLKETVDALASTATAERVVFTAPEDLTITEILIEPATALTANDSNYAVFTVARRDGTGGNRTTIDSATTQVTGTGSWTAFSTISLGGVANASLSAGQKVTIEITKQGLGVVVPVVAVQVEYTVD